MRYFYPIYPLLIIFVGIGFQSISRKFFKIIFLILIILNTYFFLNLYSRTHTRIQASQWICQNIPPKSSLTYEYWDDPLPLNLNQNCNNQNYNLIQLNISDSDNPVKWSNINQELGQSDYLILSSNRFWRSISQSPQLYPHTASFYQELFNNSSKFKLIKNFYSYPGFSLPFFKKCYLFGPNQLPGQNISFFQTSDCQNPGIYFNDSFAQESFTVYDHPQVFIFKRL